MPYLRIAFSNGAVNGVPYQQLQLMNEGLGPAKIEKIEVLENGGSISNDPIKQLEEFYPDSLSRILSADIVNTGRLIGAKEHIIMARLLNRNNQNIVIKTFKFSDAFKHFLPEDQTGKLVLKITYSSVYGDKWITRSDQSQPKEVE